MILSLPLGALAVLMFLIVFVVGFFAIVFYFKRRKAVQKAIQELLTSTFLLRSSYDRENLMKRWHSKFSQFNWLEQRRFWNVYYQQYFRGGIRIANKETLALLVAHGFNVNKKRHCFSKTPLFALYFTLDGSPAPSSLFGSEDFNEILFSVFRDDPTQLAAIERYMKAHKYPDNHPYYDNMLVLKIDKKKKKLQAAIKEIPAPSNFSLLTPTPSEARKPKTHKI